VNSQSINSCPPVDEAITLLVQAGADVNMKDNEGKTPLMRACGQAAMEDHVPAALVSTLIKNAADVNLKDPAGQTGLIMYMGCVGQYPDPTAVAALLKAGADVNAKDPNGKTPLMAAAGSIYFNSDAFAALLKAGADLNAKDANGKTALDYARDKNNSQAVTALSKAAS
jgi:ankyrin repeat protein